MVVSHNCRCQKTGLGLIGSHLHSDQARNTSNTEGTDSSQLLAWCRVAFCKLFQGCVGRETGCRVRSLSGRGRNKALEEASNTRLLENKLATVQEATHARVRRFAVVDPVLSEPNSSTVARNSQLSLDALKRSDSKQGLGESSTKSSDYCSRP